MCSCWPLQQVSDAAPLVGVVPENQRNSHIRTVYNIFSTKTVLKNDRDKNKKLGKHNQKNIHTWLFFTTNLVFLTQSEHENWTHLWYWETKYVKFFSVQLQKSPEKIDI